MKSMQQREERKEGGGGCLSKEKLLEFLKFNDSPQQKTGEQKNKKGGLPTLLTAVEPEEDAIYTRITILGTVVEVVWVLQMAGEKLQQRLELSQGPKQRLEEKGGGMGKVDLARTPPPSLAAFTTLGALQSLPQIPEGTDLFASFFFFFF